jgi:hypothetical protein
LTKRKADFTLTRMASEAKTEFELGVGKAYGRDFTPAVIGYVVTTLAVSFLVDFETAGWWKYLVALIPILPALWGVRAVTRHLGRIDEMQRATHLVAMSFGFGIAMVVALTIGFLSVAGLETERWGSWLIYAAGMAGWAVVAVRRGAPV